SSTVVTGRGDRVGGRVDRGFERPAGGEGADMELVKDDVRQAAAPPGRVRPAKRRVIHEPRKAMNAVWLPARARVGQWISAVKAVAVVGAGPGRGLSLPPAARDPQPRPAPPVDVQLHPAVP